MENTPQTSADYFKSLHILFYAILGGLIMFGTVSFVLVTIQGGIILNPILHSIFMFVLLLLLFGGFIGGKTFYQKALSKISQDLSLREKLDRYRTANLVRWGLLEAPIFFAGVAYIITAYIVFMYSIPILIFLLYMNRPMASKVIEELSLSKEEIQRIETPDTLL